MFPMPPLTSPNPRRWSPGFRDMLWCYFWIKTGTGDFNIVLWNSLVYKSKYYDLAAFFLNLIFRYQRNRATNNGGQGLFLTFYLSSFSSVYFPKITSFISICPLHVGVQGSHNLFCNFYFHVDLSTHTYNCHLDKFDG